MPRFPPFSYTCAMRLLLFLLCILLYSCSQSQDSLWSETVRTFTLGDSTVSLLVHRTTKPGLLYYNMHDDESTSVDAAKEIVEENGGILYELVHTGRRYFGFNYDSAYYNIDPNRIYTDAGVWRELRRVALRDSAIQAEAIRTQDTLTLFQQRDSLISAGDSILYVILRNQDYRKGTYAIVEGARLSLRLPLPQLQFNATDTSVFYIVRDFANALLSIMQIDTQDLVVALHNNSNNGFSLESYKLGAIYQDEAHAIYRGMHPDPDDFYFVTERYLFELLQPNQYHIVLQDNHGMTDDGSLSVYCGIHGIHYVNVEAQHKHEKEQKEMMEIMLERLSR